MSEFALEAARSALLEAQRIQAQETAAVLALRDALQAARERGAELELALDRERTGRLQAEERVAELESLIAEHAATCDEACTGCGTLMMQRHKEACPWRDAYLNHHARVTERERLTTALRKSVEAAERKRGELRG